MLAYDLARELAGHRGNYLVTARWGEEEASIIGVKQITEADRAGGLELILGDTRPLSRAECKYCDKECRDRHRKRNKKGKNAPEL